MTNYYPTKNDWEYQSGHVEGYLGEMGYSVKEEYGGESCVNFDTKIVTINSRLSPENRFYVMLHELGHIFIWEDASRSFELEHPLLVRYSDARVSNSRAGRVSIVGEEYEAWRIGRRWARDNLLVIDDKRYDKIMTDLLMTYILWAADPKSHS